MVVVAWCVGCECFFFFVGLLGLSGSMGGARGELVYRFVARDFFFSGGERNCDLLIYGTIRSMYPLVAIETIL